MPLESMEKKWGIDIALPVYTLKDSCTKKKAQPQKVALNPPKEEGGGGNDLTACNAEDLQ